MTVLLVLFISTAALLWLSIYGYVLVLGSIAFVRRQVHRHQSTYPEIAIVIPTLNEEDLILPKLADLKDTDYPRDRRSRNGPAQSADGRLDGRRRRDGVHVASGLSGRRRSGRRSRYLVGRRR